ncbi:TIGR04222 domain-containing membrane protein [Actinosynnema sp. CA-248983]
MTVATSWTSTSGVSAELWPEQQAFLAGGPGRATEVAVVSLVEAGALRIARNGLVSAVQGLPPRSWTPLQTFVLRSVPRPLGDLVTAGARSAEAQSLRQNLIEGGYVRSAGSVRAMRWVRRVFFLGWVGLVLWSAFGDLTVGTVASGFVGLIVAMAVTSPYVRPLTRAGRSTVRRLGVGVVTSEAVPLVASYGLLGKVGKQFVWQVLGIDPVAAATLRRRRKADGSSGSASCGSGCGSCSSSSCGRSSSDTGSSSSSSDSGSSCGGGGCGGGGGD